MRVPPFFGVPRLAYFSPPSRMIAGTVLSVSTLLMIVGQPYRLTTAGNGGLIRGYTRLPSSDSISADSVLHEQIEIEAGAKNIGAQIIPRIRFIQRRLHDIQYVSVFPANVDE